MGCFYYTLWSNPLLAILFNSACHLPHFLLHLKAPEAILTSWPFKNAIAFYWRRMVHQFPSLPPFIHSTCYFHPSHSVDKCPIQSLGSVQTFEHFLASLSWSLHRSLPSPQSTGQKSLFHSAVQNRTVQSIADINYVIAVTQKKTLQVTAQWCINIY